MEVSSIGLDQGRVNGAKFDVAVFTNLTRDHLDYHGTMAAYGAAKARLFAWPALACAVINADDRLRPAAHRRGARSRRPRADLRARERRGRARPAIATSARAALRSASRRRGAAARSQTGVVGAFNVSNLLATLGALLASDVALDDGARRAGDARAAARDGWSATAATASRSS